MNEQKQHLNKIESEDSMTKKDLKELKVEGLPFFSVAQSYELQN